MFGFRRTLLAALIESLLGILITALLTGALVAWVTKAATAATKLDASVSQPLSWALGAFVALLITFLLLVARHRRVMMPVERPRYRFETRRIAINYENMRAPIYRRRYKVTALANGVDRVVDSYAWTGRAVAKIDVETADCKLSTIGRNGLYTMFEVRLPHSLNKKKSFEFDVAWELDNEELNSAPFLATTITHPTRNLEFEIRLPRSSYNGAVYLKSSAHMQSETSVDAKSYAFNDGHVIISVSRPQMYSYYEVHWNWKVP